MKDLDARESRAESASGFLEEGDKRMAKGLAENDMDEIEATQKIIQLAHEKQKKAQDELQIVHQEKRKLTDKLREQASKKVKYKWSNVSERHIKYVARFAYGSTYKSQKAVYILGDVSLSERVLFKKDKLKIYVLSKKFCSSSHAIQDICFTVFS